MNWSKWINTIHTQPDKLPSLINRRLNLEPLQDEAEARALKQALKPRDDKILFLDTESRSLLAYKFNSEWKLRVGVEHHDRDSLGNVIEYSINLAEHVLDKQSTDTKGPYFSLRPLIYSGQHWLDAISQREIQRFSNLEQHDLSVMFVNCTRTEALFDMVESLRRGDRVGYFDGDICVLLPFTSADKALSVHERIRSEFIVQDMKIWSMETDFENHYELSTQVKKKL